MGTWGLLGRVALGVCCLAGCSAYGQGVADAPPLFVEAPDGGLITISPANRDFEEHVPSIFFIQLSEELAPVALESFQWLHDVTGIPAPLFEIFECPPGGDCIVYDDTLKKPARSTIEPDAGVKARWLITVHPSQRTPEDWTKVVRHEYAHLWRYPDPGVDGTGHSATHSILYPGLAGVDCPGFTTEELDAICSHRDCGEVTAECDD